MFTADQILKLQFDDYARDMTKREREMLLVCSGYPPSKWTGPRKQKRDKEKI